MHIGLQISSLKPFIQTRAGVRDTFRRVAGMGYRDVQLQWTGADVPCEFIADEMKANGLDCWGTQDYYDVVMARMDYEIRAAHLYGSHYICVSGIPERFMSPEGIRAMAAEMTETQRRLSDEGIALTFHPRHMEYAQVDGDTAACRLLDCAPDIQLTLDAYHSAIAGVDTAALMRRYAGRVDIIHLKDAAECKKGATLTPVGAGAIDFMPVISACRDAGVKAIMAEQESWQDDAFECMKQSLSYLRGALKTLHYT